MASTFAIPPHPMIPTLIVIITSSFKSLSSLVRMSSLKLIAFCDVDISKAACAAEAYGTDNAKVYDDYKALLKDEF
jgi:predicted dehydrogenase